MNDDWVLQQVVEILFKYYEKNISRSQAFEALRPLCSSLSDDHLDDLGVWLGQLRENDILCAQLSAEVLRETFLDCDRPEAVALMSFSLGSTYEDRRDNDNAIRCYEETLALLVQGNRVTEKREWLVQFAYANMAKRYMDVGKPGPLVIELLQKALEIAERRDDTISCAKYHQDIGVAYQRQGHLSKTLKSYLHANEYAKQLKHYPERARLESSLVAIYVDLGEYDQARPHAKEADLLSQELGLPDQRLETLNNLIVLNVHLGELRRAAEFCHQGVELSKKILKLDSESRFQQLLDMITALQSE